MVQNDLVFLAWEKNSNKSFIFAMYIHILIRIYWCVERLQVDIEMSLYSSYNVFPFSVFFFLDIWVLFLILSVSEDIFFFYKYLYCIFCFDNQWQWKCSTVVTLTISFSYLLLLSIFIFGPLGFTLQRLPFEAIDIKNLSTVDK